MPEVIRWGERSLKRGAIVWAPTLSLELAIASIEAGVSEILTHQGSPHCHGAIHLLAHPNIRWSPGVTWCRATARLEPVETQPSWTMGEVKRPLESKQGGRFRTYINPQRDYASQRPASDLLAQHLGIALTTLLGVDIRGGIDAADHMYFESDKPFYSELRATSISSALEGDQPQRALASLDGVLADFRESQQKIGSASIEALEQLLHQAVSAAVRWHWNYSEVYATLAQNAESDCGTPLSSIDLLGTSRIALWERSGGLRTDAKMGLRVALVLPATETPLSDFSQWWALAEQTCPSPALKTLGSLVLVKEWRLVLIQAVLSRLSTADLDRLVARNAHGGSHV